MRLLLPCLAVILALSACSPSWNSGAPVSRGDSSSAARPTSVTVYSGDTVYGIARRYNVPVRDLIELNRLPPPYSLQPGMVLRLPGGSDEHVVQRGDTLSVLARRYGVGLQELAAANNKRPPYTIFPGERLTIPGSGQEARRGSGGGSAIVLQSPNRDDASASRSESPAPRPAASSPSNPNPAFQPSQPLPATPPPLAGRGFIWPVKGQVVAEFGPGAKGQHNDGINIAAPRGTEIKAAENGVVAYAGNELKGFGNLLLVKHADNWMTAYAHADTLLVTKGDTVRKGQRIATVGSTGGVGAPQLHFEIRNGTEAVDPADHLTGGM